MAKTNYNEYIVAGTFGHSSDCAHATYSQDYIETCARVAVTRIYQHTARNLVG
jgi:hypothetical protein